MDLLGLYRSLSCLLVCGLALGCALPQGRHELDVGDNEVWSPNGRSKISFRSLIQALYRLNALGLPEEVEDQMSEEGEGEDLLMPSDVTDPDDDYPLQPSVAPHLVEEVPDVLPLPVELDKSHKFTHSFRFGYGAPV